VTKFLLAIVDINNQVELSFRNDEANLEDKTQRVTTEVAATGFSRWQIDRIKPGLNNAICFSQLLKNTLQEIC
jgi:hypothetical protein